MRSTAPAIHDFVVGGARCPPSCAGQISSSRFLAVQVAASSSTTNAGSATVRLRPVLSVPDDSPATDRDRVLVQQDASLAGNSRPRPAARQPRPTADPRCRAAAPASRTGPTPAPGRAAAQRVRYTLRRLALRGSVTPRAGLAASIRSRTASSRMPASTEKMVMTRDAESSFDFDSSDIHACTLV